MRTTHIVASIAAAVLVAACATYTPPSETETRTVIREGFKDRGIAKVDRLNQSDLQATCSKFHNEPPADERARLEKAAAATIKYPSDGRFLGDFKAGERVAQTGVGMQWTDAPGTVNGGNCYACHQISKEEIAYGNIGPSLYQYRKARGSTDETLRYTWGKIWNTHAFKACSQMPRFGDAGILTEQQIKDVMALLLDPESPVNK